MRRMWMGHLILLAGLGVLTSTSRFARAADLPFAGSWKIVALPDTREINFWLVKIDKEGKKVEVISGLPGYGNNKVADLKADASAIRWLFKGANNNEYGIVVRAPDPTKKDAVLLGTARFGTNFFPIRVEKTEMTEIDQKKAVLPTGGLADLQAALKTPDVEDKIKDLQDVIKDYEGKPISLLASQVLLGELVKKKAPADAFKPVGEAYLKSASPYGREMRIQAHFNLSRGLLGYEKTTALALDHAQKAAKLLKANDYRGTRLTVYLDLVSAEYKNNKEEDVKKTLATILEITDDVIAKPRVAVGPLIPMQQMASMLLASPVPSVADAGLTYARKAEKLLKEDTSVADRLATYKLLRSALAMRKKADEAKELMPKINKLEEDLDKEYLKDAIPFKPDKFGGRKGKSDRAVVVEIFTGAQCPPCVSADIAFDALGKTYPAKDVVLLQYHLHIPALDPMTTPDSLARQKYYADDIEGTPTMFIDGKVTPGMGGAKFHAKARYESLRELVDKALESGAGPKIKLEAKREGEKMLNISANVTDVKGSSDKVRVRFVLVEQTVRYPGRNGLRLHHHVVREMPGGAAGFKYDKTAPTSKASVDLEALRKKLNGIQASLVPGMRSQQIPVPEWGAELKKLKVVALVQDDDTKKILQAAEVDVSAPAPKKEQKNDKEEKKEKD